MEVSAPGTPEANNIRLYAKDSSGSSTLCYKGDNGSETCLPLSGSIIPTTAGGAAGEIAFFDAATNITSDSTWKFNDTTKTVTLNGGGIDTATIILRSGGAANRAEYSIGRTATDGVWAVAGVAANYSDIVATAGEVVLRTDTSNLILTARNASGAIKFATGAADTLKAIITNGGAFGVGTATPNSIIEASSALTTTARGISSLQTSADTSAAAVFLRKSRGAAGAVQSGDVLGNFVYLPHDGVGFVQVAGIRCIAGELFSGTAHGNSITFSTTALLSTTETERFRIGPSGQWGIGGATFGTAGNLFQSGGASAAPSWLDHTTDFLAQYFLLAGRSGGQVAIGSTGASTGLTLTATSHATPGAGGDIVFKVGASGGTEVMRLQYDSKVGIGITPLYKTHIFGASTAPTSGATKVPLLALHATTTAAIMFGLNPGSPFGGWIQAQDGTTLSDLYPLALQPLGSNVSIGTLLGPGAGSGALIFGDLTAPSSMGSNTAGLYADDVGGTVRMFAIDEANDKTELGYADKFCHMLLLGGM